MRKRKIKSIVCSILVIALLAGSAALLVSIFSNDKTEIGASAFSIGAIDNQGAYTASEQSVYTKELIECQGLTIEPDFDAKGTFKIFYYDLNKEYIGTPGAYDSSSTVYEKLATFKLAKYCRIMITPEAPLDEDGNLDTDYTLGYLDIYDIVSDYTITVDKEQDFVKALIGDSKNEYKLATEGDEATEYLSEEISSLEGLGSKYLLLKIKSSTLAAESFGLSHYTKIDNSGNYDTFDIPMSFVLSDNGKVTYVLFSLSSVNETMGESFTIKVDYESRNICEAYFIK